MDSGSTNQTCNVSGEYRCSMHSSNTILIQKGEKFPLCPQFGGHPASWILVNAS